MKKIKNNYIKSPLNYTGGKHKLLSQIIPLMPSDINTFVDLFGGGFNVGINIDAKNVIYNDTQQVVEEMLKDLSNLTSDDALYLLDQTLTKYDLSKTNKDGFLRIRNDYNEGSRSWDMFYAMICHAFNYQIKFNKDNNYNEGFGKDRSSFNPTLRKHFVRFVDKLSDMRFLSRSQDFRLFPIQNLTQQDVVYCDPPYYITSAYYNKGGKGWSEQDEIDLLEVLDNLSENNVKFALSNVLYHKDRKNNLLIEWSKKYNIHYLNADYKNCMYNGNISNGKTVEVLITNY